MEESVNLIDRLSKAQSKQDLEEILQYISGLDQLDDYEDCYNCYVFLFNNLPSDYFSREDMSIVRDLLAKRIIAFIDPPSELRNFLSLYKTTYECSPYYRLIIKISPSGQSFNIDNVFRVFLDGVISKYPTLLNLKEMHKKFVQEVVTFIYDGGMSNYVGDEGKAMIHQAMMELSERELLAIKMEYGIDRTILNHQTPELSLSQLNYSLAKAHSKLSHPSRSRNLTLLQSQSLIEKYDRLNHEICTLKNQLESAKETIKEYHEKLLQNSFVQGLLKQNTEMVNELICYRSKPIPLENHILLKTVNGAVMAVPKEFAEISIEKLDTSVELYQMFRRADIKTLLDLCQLSQKDIRGINGGGSEKGLTAIRRLLKEYNLELGMTLI